MSARDARGPDDKSMSGPGGPRSGKNSAAAFVLEGELQLGAVGRDLALLDDQVLLEDLGDAQVAQRLGRPVHRRLCRQLPGLAAGAYELDHLVDAVRHGYLPRHGRSEE